MEATEKEVKDKEAQEGGEDGEIERKGAKNERRE